MSARHETEGVLNERRQRGPGDLRPRPERLIVLYIRVHPRPFLISVLGAMLFASASIALTTVLGRVTNHVLAPAFERRRSSREIWLLPSLALWRRILRRSGSACAATSAACRSSASCETIRTQDRRPLPASSPLAYHREQPTGELLAHMEADVKAAVEVFCPCRSRPA